MPDGCQVEPIVYKIKRPFCPLHTIIRWIQAIVMAVVLVFYLFSKPATVDKCQQTQLLLGVVSGLLMAFLLDALCLLCGRLLQIHLFLVDLTAIIYLILVIVLYWNAIYQTKRGDRNYDMAALWTIFGFIVAALVLSVIQIFLVWKRY